jgi:hypothetical protein
MISDDDEHISSCRARRRVAFMAVTVTVTMQTTALDDRTDTTSHLPAAAAAARRPS